MKLIFQSEIQRTEQLAVSFFSFFVDTLSKVIGFSFILCHCHIFKDRHGRAGSHGRILKNASDSSHAFIFRHICDIGAVDQDSSFINRNAPADNIQHGSFSGTVAADNRNKLTVIDFKSDRIQPGGEALRGEEYRRQLCSYSRALEEILGRPVRRRVLWFFATGRAWDV